MQKFKKSDLVVKSPGLQIRERIQNDYGNIKIFSQKIGMSESSVDQYLTHKNMGSTTFKIRLIRELGQDFNTLYQSDLDQVENMIDRFCDHLPLYDQLQDSALVDQLLKLGRTYEVSGKYMARLFHAMAHFKKAEGYHEKAVFYLQRAATITRGLGSQNSSENLANILCDLILTQRYTATLDKMYRDVNEFAILLKSLTDTDLKSKLCLKVGEAFIDRGEQATGVFYLNQALDLASVASILGHIHLNLALIMDPATEGDWHLKEAEKYLKDEKDAQFSLLITRAEHAFKLDNPSDAKKYTQMAIERCGKKLTAASPKVSQLWLKLHLNSAGPIEDLDVNKSFENLEIEGLNEILSDERNENSSETPAEELLDNSLEYSTEDLSTSIKVIQTYTLKLASELPKGYLSSRGHLQYLQKYLAESKEWHQDSTDWLNELAAMHRMSDLHETLKPLYLQVLGQIAVLNSHYSHN